jgi:hypothetical protein
VARKIRSRVEYRYHHFAWYGLIPESDYCRAFHGQENINTYLANQAAKRAFPNWRIPEAIDFLANSVDPESPDKRKDAFWMQIVAMIPVCNEADIVKYAIEQLLSQ